ncbi:MAG: GrpB family protein [Oscillospiraceae bacterium]|nr:GrpB family protein [Oscillospiraceae bacterium]
MKTKRVTVTPYNPHWPDDFEAIRRELAAGLGELIVDIHHVGSTSVPGLSSKPIIDIDVEIKDYSVFPEAVARLQMLGYAHEGDLGIPQREAFCYAGKAHLRKHHLYVCPADSEELRRHITFRDHLRRNPEDAAAYGAVKEKAARLYPDSIDDYMKFKSEIICKLYRKCALM